MPKRYELKQAVQNIKRLKGFSLVFTDKDLRDACQKDVERLRLDYRAVNALIKQGRIKHVFRIYSPDKPDQYVDYTRRDLIPFNDYAYYEPTGEEFFVSKYTLPEVFYQFM